MTVGADHMMNKMSATTQGLWICLFAAICVQTTLSGLPIVVNTWPFTNATEAGTVLFQDCLRNDHKDKLINDQSTLAERSIER